MGIERGRDGAAERVADGLAGAVANLLPRVFELASVDLRDPAVGPPTLFDDSFWNGPAVSTVHLHGALCEWSMDSIGWLAALIADAIARLGGSTPVVCTIKRAPTMPG